MDMHLTRLGLSRNCSCASWSMRSCFCADAASAAMFASAIETSACVGAVKLIETLSSLPGVNRVRSAFGCSAHRAAERGDMKTLRRLLLIGAELGPISNPSGVDDGGGWSVLHFAAAAGDVEILEFLLERGCDKSINMQDYSGFTALHVAVHRGRYECARLLLMKGAAAVYMQAAVNELSESRDGQRVTMDAAAPLLLWKRS